MRMSKRGMRSCLACLAGVLAGSGCMVRLGPKPVELKRFSKPPIFRLGTVTEEFTGSWAEKAKANNLGGKDALIAVLRHSEAASLFSNDPSNLVVDIHLVTHHEDDEPRVAMLGVMSIVTLGLLPLSYHSEAVSEATITVKMPDGAPLEQQHYRAKGTYDILAFPPTMFTLGAASLRGAQDVETARQRTARRSVADMMEVVERDYDRLARTRQSWAVVADQQPISVQVGAATYWVTYNIAPAKGAGAGGREYVLEMHQSRPRRGAAPWRSVAVGDAGPSADAEWRWRDPRGVAFYAEGRLWHPEWKAEGPQARLAAVAFKERPFAAKELFAPDTLGSLSASDWNDLLVAWKSRELVGLLREGRTDDLRGHVAQIEQLVLRADEAAEREKDEAQKLIAAGKPGAELHAEAARAYRARIEVLKPVLAAIKQEAANRQK